MDLLRALEWRRFETLVCRYWQLKGYDATTTGLGADGGVDVILRDRKDPDRIFAVAQCKSWINKSVGVETVRALWGSLAHFDAKLALLYTVQGYTDAAREFATGKHLKLIDGNALLAQIESLPPEESRRLWREITDGDYSTPSCPICESKMRLRKGKEGKAGFWGCPDFPRCRSSPIPVRD